ncbi:MAG: hypothetical protein EFT35_07065 [Methanophagales archaeon ANME-1-THS]|nr:MAG: hypothetical protein EFT35_07065 [Methanophagales archaeon ANME-1-THS]
MEAPKTYDNFPAWIAILSNLVSLSIYTLGAYILAGFGILFAILYLLYCLWLEVQILRKSCVDCYYYGKVCGLGKGKLCPLLFKQGDPKKFVEKEVTWAQILPDFMVFIIPLVGGIILLVRDFTWLLVALLIILGILAFGGTALIRGSFACKYCKQREIGCPAEQLFGGKEKL